MSEKKIENQKRPFEIRDYNPGDEAAICALFEKVFGKPMGKTESLRHWQWEFLANPTGGLFVKLAWDNARLVGQYTASSLRVCADGKEIIAALSHDTMWAPEYSGSGIFLNTAQALYHEQAIAGHSFIYGFPNRNSIHGFIKNLKWQQIMPAPVHIRPVRLTKSVSSRLFGRAPFAGKNAIPTNISSLPFDSSGVYKLRTETKFGSWVDELWQRCRQQHRLWVIRDQNYLNWRYVRKPENKYHIVSAWKDDKPVGYVVFVYADINFGNSVFVMDFMADLNFHGVADVLIRYVIKAAQMYNCAFASVLLTPGSKYLWLFRRNLFLPLPEKMFPQPLYFGARCFDPSIENLVNNPKAWSISWGDNDVL